MQKDPSKTGFKKSYTDEFAEKYNLKLETFKKDANDRLYFVYQKL